MERWNLEKRLETNVLEEKIPEWLPSAIEQGLMTPIDHLVECKKSKEEQAVLHAVNMELDKKLRELQLPPIHVDDASVHIVEPEFYRAHPKLRNGQGKTLEGHVYLQRSSSVPRLLRDSSHEYIHASSFRTILALYWQEQTKDGISHNTTTTDRRSGFSFQPRDHKKEIQFNGLNEGVIELLAHDLRERLIEKNVLSLSDDDRKEALLFAYPHPNVLLKLLQTITTSEHSASEWKRMLYEDLFRGTYASIKELDRVWKSMKGTHITPILRRMDPSYVSAIRTASELGFTGLAKNLQEQLAKQPDGGKNL